MSYAVFRLAYVVLEDISFTDLPSLKILHLYSVLFIDDQDYSHIFSSCPNLEHLEVKSMNVMTSCPNLEHLEVKSMNVMTNCRS